MVEAKLLVDWTDSRILLHGGGKRLVELVKNGLLGASHAGCSSGTCALFEASSILW